MMHRGGNLYGYREKGRAIMHKRIYTVLTVMMFLLVGAWVVGYKSSRIVSLASDNGSSTMVATSKGSEMNWHDNGQNGVHLVELAQGTLASSMVGTVLTDTDCAPDATGLSHCHDVIRLKNHTLITVINPHDMKYVACLAAGQVVKVSPKANQWVVLENKQA